MPQHKLPIIAVTQTLEHELYLAEALFFPETLRFNDDEQRAQESLQANLHKLVEELPLAWLHQRHPAGAPEVGEAVIPLAPPTHNSLWRVPVTLRLPVVYWQHGSAAQIANVPALHIEVVATNPATRTALERKLSEQIEAALVRSGARHSLGRLIWLQRCRELQIARQQIEVILLTPKQIAARELARQEEQKSALAEAGTDLTKETLPAAFEMDELVAQLAEALTGKQARSVLLIGRSGVGKTAAVYELARRRGELQLGHTPFWATNGSRLIAGMSGFGQWQERCQKLWREAAEARAVLYLGNLIELMEVGKYSGNSQGIAGFLRPYIARGDVLAIAECTSEQLSLIERADPRLLQAFQQLRIEEPTGARGRTILLSFALAHSNGAEIELESIERADQLHRRYAAYSAYPGRPVRFLKNLLQDRTNPAPLTAEEVTAAFSRETGLPRVLLDEREQLDLNHTRDWFAARVIGQPDATDLIVDLLATVKAGLTRPRKPIASLLFIGPTGVGKTEMAKALAEFLFQDRNRLVRFDMSEYADAFSVNRLIGGQFGSEGLLTAKVREQPFAVVLLDEFEKAHPLFFDLLLQVLGEGRLTDALGRVADFSNAVVIMTSNLGAQSFQRGLVGFKQAAATRQAASKHFLTAVRKALRPEMFNRIDRIVPFAPLDETTVERITVRELERLRERDGLRYRGVQLEIADGVAQHFARRGYEPRYGARPLKRIIERELLVPLAEQLNQHSHEALTARLWLEDETLKLAVQSVRNAATSLADHPLANLVRDCQQTRREAQALQHSPTVRTLQNEIYTLERLEKRLARGKWRNPADAQRLTPLPRLRQAAQTLNDFVTKIAALEDEALLTLYGRRTTESNDLQARLAQAFNQWPEILLAIYALKFKKTDEITFALFSEDAALLFELAALYCAIAQRRNAQLTAYQFTARHQRTTRAKSKSANPDEPAALERHPIETINEFLSAPRPGVIGLAFGLTAPLIFPLFELERGLHRFKREKKSSECLVLASEETLDEYKPPAGIARQGALGNYELRRTYQFDQVKLKDALLDAEWQWDGRLSVHVLESLLQESLLKQARALFAP